MGSNKHLSLLILVTTFDLCEDDFILGLGVDASGMVSWRKNNWAGGPFTSAMIGAHGFVPRSIPLHGFPQDYRYSHERIDIRGY